jgi:dethiobiotin synthetase
MRRIVVLGTGTDVGKTYVTCLVARALASSAGAPAVQALKPIETGINPANATYSDAHKLRSASSVPTPEAHPLYTFEPPLSPHLAARRASTVVDTSAITRWCNEASQYMASHVTSFQIIETAGGACSPLGPMTTNLDLARALEPALWILVAPDALGVLHDVRAALCAFAAVARPPDFLVLSGAREPDLSTGTNAAELGRVGLPEPIAVVARGGGAIESLVEALLAS